MRAIAAVFLIPAGAALAQSSVFIDVENPVLMPGERTTVTLWGGFSREEYALAGVVTSLLSSHGGLDGWSEFSLIEPMTAIGSTVGEATVSGIEGIAAGQYNWPVGLGADPSNPIAFWSATYTAPADVPRPFDIELESVTASYHVYLSRETTVWTSRLSTLTEGHATIHIVPAPAGVVVLGVGALGVFATGRRRR